MSCGIKRILQFNDAMIPGPIQVFNMENRDITTLCMYSWSSDMVCWTNWTNYNNYIRISNNLEGDVYIRVLLFDSLSKISINGLFTTCYSICLDQSNPFLIDFCGEETQFNPYMGLDCAILLQQQLANSVICLFGIPIYYFKVDPKVESADFTFKEYVLHNVSAVKKLKLMIPDGTMPSSNPKFNALDFDWEVDWDVELGKTDFAKAFGDTAFPNNKDFIYIPLMKRMWSVNTAYDEKNEGLMWHSTTWKLSLVKYEENTNINIPDNMEELIDNWVVNNYEDVFGKVERIEQDRLSGSPQLEMPKRAATNLYNIDMEDSIRRQYSRGEVSVIDYQYNHRSNVVARNIYKFKHPTSTVTYQNGYCGSDGTLSFILQTQGMPTDGQSIITVGPIEVLMKFQRSGSGENKTSEDRYLLQFGNTSCYIKPFSTQLVILRWNKSTFTTNLSVYEYVHRDDMPKYMLKPEMYWFNEEPICNEVGKYDLDFEVKCKQECYIQPYPCMITNIKLYNKDLGEEESIKESIKYTTRHSACVINDLARHIESGHGYEVK